MASPRIRDLPDDERPREKLAAHGPQALSHAELIAIFLRVGLPGRSAVDLGREMLQHGGGTLQGLARATVSELSQHAGVGLAKAAQLAAAFELGRRMWAEEAVSEGMTSPESVYKLLGNEMRGLPYESLRVVLLNTRRQLIKSEEITRGTLNESLAHPREILRSAIGHSAHGFILVHNHPSGDPTPSKADRDLTRRIARASGEVGVEFLDHIIIGAPAADREPFFSFREFGLL